MGQGLLVLKHRAEIALVEPAATRLAFPKVFGFGQRLAAGLLADDGAARDLGFMLAGLVILIRFVKYTSEHTGRSYGVTSSAEFHHGTSMAEGREWQSTAHMPLGKTAISSDSRR
jgi:hypothetical protein